MQAARRVFTRRGYHAASLDLVARAAGLTKGAVYARFSSKAELMLALFEDRVGERAHQMGAARAGVPRSPAAVTAALARQWAELARADPGWSLLVLEFRVHAARDRALNQRFSALDKRLRASIAAAMKDVAPGTSADDLARLAMALSSGFALERAAHGDASANTLYERAALALVRGMAP